MPDYSLADILLAAGRGGAFGTMTPQEEAVTPANALDRLVSGAGQTIGKAVMAPGNAYKYGGTTEEMIQPAADLAMLMIGTPGGTGGLGSGMRPLSFTEKMAQDKDLAFQRTQKYGSTGDYGLGTVKRTEPDAPKGSMEYSSDRLMSSLRDTQRQLQEYKNPSQGPLLAPGESMNDFSLFSGGNEKAGATIAGIRAYHGSPYDFDKFDLSRIGTGEGAQSYGHGLYFAENPAVARDYKKRLAPGNAENITPDDEAISAIKPKWDEVVAKLRAAREASGEKMTAETAALQNHLDALHDHAVSDTLSRKPWLTQGRMYEVNINAKPEQFIDWDKPLSQQLPAVQDIAREIGFTPGAQAEFGLPWLNKGLGLPVETRNPLGGDIYRRMAQTEPHEASAALNQAGIPGIKYLDQGSRQMVGLARQMDRWPPYRSPTSNYVVFNPDLIDILRKYAVPGMATPAGLLQALSQEQQQ